MTAQLKTGKQIDQWKHNETRKNTKDKTKQQQGACVVCFLPPSEKAACLQRFC